MPAGRGDAGSKGKDQGEGERARRRHTVVLDQAVVSV
jgi:hypothetical protein